MNSPDENKEIKDLIRQAEKIRLRIEQDTDPLRVAEELIKKQPIYFDEQRNYWIWIPREYRWKRIDETDILNLVDKHFDISGGVITGGYKNKILTAIQMVGRRIKPLEPRDTWIQLKDKIIDIETGEEIPATPRYFITNMIPWEMGESTETPNIDKLLEQWVGRDKVRLLKEIMAWILMPNYSYQKIVILHGSGSNGKSMFLKLIRKIIGQHNVASVDLNKLLTSRFEAVKIYKKLLCEVAELNEKKLNNEPVLKRLTGDDTISAEYKHKDSFDFYNYAKIIINTNYIPESSDKSDGWYRRIVIVDFPNKFREGPNPLRRISDEEIKNLVKQLVEIAKEMWHREVYWFTGEPSLEEKKREYEARSNPLLRFINEQTIEDPDQAIPLYEFYDRFRVWLRDQRYFGEYTKREVSSKLKQLGYEVKKKDIKKGEERYVWTMIYGLAWKTNKVGGDEDGDGFPPVPPVPPQFQFNSIYKKLNENTGGTGGIGGNSNNFNIENNVPLEKFEATTVSNGNPDKPIKNQDPVSISRAIRELFKNRVEINYEYLLDFARLNNIDQDLLDECIASLKKYGWIYEPKPGVFKKL